VSAALLKLRSAAFVPVLWRPRLRAVALALYGCVFVVAVKVYGLPFEREQVILWVCGGLLIASIGKERRWRAFVDFLPFVLLMAVYDYTRGAAETLGMPLQWTPQLDVDKALFGDTVPTVWLQERLLGPETQWWQLITAATYVSHFVAPFAVAGVLWIASRAAFVGYARRFLTLSYVGLLTYILLPAAPPWKAGQIGFIEPVERVSTQGFTELGLERAQSFVEKGQETVNLYAALPSLHAAYTMLIAAFLWKRVAPWWRPLLGAYPLLMCFTLVYGAEHYVSDILLGWAYAGLVMLGWGWWERGRPISGGGVRRRRAKPDGDDRSHSQAHPRQVPA